MSGVSKIRLREVARRHAKRTGLSRFPVVIGHPLRVLGVLLIAMIVTWPAQGQTAAGAGKRPNFLFIIVDDQSPFDLAAYNPKTALRTSIELRVKA